MTCATTLVLVLLMSDAAVAQEARRDLYDDPLPKGARMRLGTLRFRHSGELIWCAAYSPNGKLLATGGEDQCIRLWDPQTGEELHRLNYPFNFPLTLAFSPDSKLLAAGGTAETFRLWDIASGKCLRTIQQNETLHRILFSRDGKWVISGGADYLRVWETATGKCLRTLKGPEEDVYDLSLSSDGKLLTSASEKDGGICLREVSSGKLLRACRQRTGVAHRVRFAPDGKTLASSDSEGNIYLWNPATGKEIRHWKAHEEGVRSLAFASAGRTLLSSGEDGIREWDAATGKQLRLLVEWSRTAPALCLSPDGKMLATVALEKIVRRWDLAGGKEILQPRGHEASINSIRFADKGKRLVSTGTDGSVRIWDLATGKELDCDRTKPLPLQEPPPIDLSADGRTLAAVTNEQTVCLRDRFSKKVIAAIPTVREVKRIGFSPDGKYLAAGTGNQIIHLWDVAAAKECCRIKGCTLMRPPIFSPDSRLLAIMDAIPVQEGGSPIPADRSTVGGIHIWGTGGGKKIQYIPSGDEKGLLTPLCFSPGGRMLVGWPRKPGQKCGVLIAWEVATGRERFRLKPSRNNISAAAFSADGTTLAISEAHVIRLRDVRTGQERQQFYSDQGEIRSLAFSEDGRQLASGGKNTTILLWPISASSRKRPTAEPDLSVVKLQALWSDLAGEDAARAFDSMQTIAASPASTAAFLRQHLRPVNALDRATTQRLIADLDGDDFDLRERATKELVKLGDAAEHLLRQALRKKPTLELRRRAEVLLEKLAKETPERLRKRRALEVLEWLDTVESHRLLEDLSGGAADAWLTGEAKRARHRQHRSSEPRP